MIATLTLAAAVLASPVPKDSKPAGPAPRLVEFAPDSDGKVRVTALRNEPRKVQERVPVQKQVVVKVQLNGKEIDQPVIVTEMTTREREVTVSSMVKVELAELKNLMVYTADGKEADKAAALKKLAEGGMAVVSSDGQKVDPKYLKLFRDDTLVLVSPELVASAPPAPMPARMIAPAVLPGKLLPLPPPPVLAPAPPVAAAPAARVGAGAEVERFDTVPLPPVAPAAPPAAPVERAKEKNG